MSKFDLYGRPLRPGVNLDLTDIPAGLAMARKIGYRAEAEQLVIQYALSRHAKGEEDLAQRTAVTNGITLTNWYMILSAALASAQSRKEDEMGKGEESAAEPYNVVVTRRYVADAEEVMRALGIPFPQRSIASIKIARVDSTDSVDITVTTTEVDN